MYKNKKIIIFGLSILFIVTFTCFLVNAAAILYPKDALTGPGSVEQLMKEKQKELVAKIERIKKENGIASQSEIFLHDGVYYMKGEDKGDFMLTGFCACSKCGSGTGYTASGKKCRENHTIASDWSVLPKNTFVILTDAIGKDGTVYDGVYQVEDRGGGVKKNHIDIYRPTHELASLVTYYGRCYGHVYIAIPIANESDFE